MTTLRTAPRILTGLSAFALSIGALTGCTPEPEPTPTPTAAFASEEEAFAAAEEVYREYNEAGNARLRGEETPDPQDFLVGAALEDDIDGLDLLRTNDIQLLGEITVLKFIGKTGDIGSFDSQVTSTVCLDIARTRVVDSTGTDVTPPERPPVVAQEVTMTYDGSSFLISKQAETAATVC